MELFKKKIKFLEILFVISLCVSFYTRIGKTYNINYFVKIIIASIWTLYAIFSFFMSNDKKHDKNLNKLLLIFISPILFLIGYNLFLVALDQVESIYIGRMISNLYSMFIVITFSFASIYLFKKRTFRLVIYAIILNFISLIFINFLLYGIDCFEQLYLSILGDINATNSFEVHDLTFAIGILFIFCFSNYKRYIYLIVFFLIIMFFGFKRIQLLTLFLCALIFMIFRIVSEKNKYRYILFVNLGVLLVSLVYIMLIKNGMLFRICDYLGIETMGRLTLYKWISDYFSFSPFYIGIGTGTTFKMTELLTTWGIYALHSDILRMYVEIGFIPFILWLNYYLFYLPYQIKKEYTSKSTYLYFFITLYLFMIHFTDNTVLYFTTQYMYIFVLTYCLLYLKDDERIQE